MAGAVSPYCDLRPGRRPLPFEAALNCVSAETGLFPPAKRLKSFNAFWQKEQCLFIPKMQVSKEYPAQGPFGLEEGCLPLRPNPIDFPNLRVVRCGR